MKIIKIREDVFETEITIFYNCSYQEFSKKVKQQFNVVLNESDETITISGQCFNYFNNKSGKSLRFIFLEKLNKSPKFIGILTHELFHMVVRVLDDKGVPIVRNVENKSGDETGSYLLESYLVKVLNKI